MPCNNYRLKDTNMQDKIMVVDADIERCRKLCETLGLHHYRSKAKSSLKGLPELLKRVHPEAKTHNSQNHANNRAAPVGANTQEKSDNDNN